MCECHDCQRTAYELTITGLNQRSDLLSQQIVKLESAINQLNQRISILETIIKAYGGRSKNYSSNDDEDYSE